MKIIRTFFLVFTFFLIFASVSFAQTGNTYYVDGTNGNDSFPGTQTSPWKTIQKAANTLLASDTVIINAGIYNETVLVNTSGTSPTNMINFKTNGTVTVLQFIINGNYINLDGFTVTPLTCGGNAAIQINGNYNFVQNNKIQDSTRVGIITSASTNSNTIRRNTITRTFNIGMQIYGKNHLIENNDISDIRDIVGNCTGGEGGDAFNFFGSGNIFRGNYIHDFFKVNNPGKPHIDAWQTFSALPNDTSAKNTIIERNHVFFGNSSTGKLEEAWDGVNTISGFMIEGTASDKADNIIIRNNLIESWKGLDAGGGVGSNNVSNLKIYNNVFRSDLNFSSSYWPQGMSIHGGTTFEIFNNITVDFNGNHIGINVGDGSSGSYDYNLMWNSNGSTPQLSGYTVAIHDKFGIDPKFVANFTNYHLQSGSPAIDNGLTISSVMDDFDGTSRPQGSGFDIGAYEYTTNSPTLTPFPTPAGDINQDGKIDGEDLIVLLKNYLSTTYTQADLNKDSLVNMIDAAMLIGNIGKIP